MNETQESVSRWGDETFGIGVREAALTSRANTELAELIREAAGPARTEALLDECADVAILLLRIASRRSVIVGLNDSIEDVPAVLVDRLMQLSEVQMAVSAHSEMSWLLAASCYSGHADWAEPAILQVLYVLAAICWKQGSTLQQAVNRKMATNRTRVWVVENGTGHHVRARDMVA